MVEEFLKELGNNSLVAFYAPMGAGKTMPGGGPGHRLV